MKYGGGVSLLRHGRETLRDSYRVRGGKEKKKSVLF